MMTSFQVSGNISSEQIVEAIQKFLPDANVFNVKSPPSVDMPRSLNDIYVTESSSFEFDERSGAESTSSEIAAWSSDSVDESKDLRKEIYRGHKKLANVENELSKSYDQIDSAHKQLSTLFSQFELLRKKYDNQRIKFSSILWSECTPHHPELKHIPPPELSQQFVESESQVGPYLIHKALGEGQFASVKQCRRNSDDSEFALKVIQKDRILSFQSLIRLSYELQALQILRSPLIAAFCDVIHTKSKLYIVMEKGGNDLFSFFDLYPKGVDESIAKQITGKLFSAVQFCHNHHICHRDLKPEVRLYYIESNTHFELTN